MTLLDTFLSKIKVIKEKQPRYKQGCDGSNGYCDCIGLVIGAFNRAKIKWSGIHGSNWFARKEITGLSKVTKESDLKVGDAVFQTYEPGEAGYDLPGRYKKGGKYYNGDLRDYMHIGIVTSVNPLRITHMWQPSVRDDTTIKFWTYRAWLKRLGTEPIPKTDPSTPQQGSKAKVVAPSGKTVKMRKNPSQNCRIYEELPIGTIVTIDNPGEDWAQISYGNWKGWYMMAKFLEVIT